MTRLTRLQAKAATTQELLSVYRSAALAHGRATEIGDSKAGNKAARQIAGVYSELRLRGEAAQRELIPLILDEAPYVRLWSASHAMDFAPSEGQPALRRLASQGGILGFTAKVTLEEWGLGRLSFP